MSSDKVHGLIYIPGLFIPTIAPWNSPLLHLGKKGRFQCYNNYPVLLTHHLCLCRCLFNCPKACSWCFGLRGAFAFNFCSSMFPTFYSTMKIQRWEILWGLGWEFSYLLFPFIHILLEDFICFIFCILKSQELVRGALLPFRKSFSIYFFCLLIF